MYSSDEEIHAPSSRVDIRMKCKKSKRKRKASASWVENHSIQRRLLRGPDKQEVIGPLTNWFYVYNPKLKREMETFQKQHSDHALVKKLSQNIETSLKNASTENGDLEVLGLVQTCFHAYMVLDDRSLFALDKILPFINHRTLHQSNLIWSLVSSYLIDFYNTERKYKKAIRECEKALSLVCQVHTGRWTGSPHYHAAQMYDLMAHLRVGEIGQYLNNAYYHYRLAREHYPCESNMDQAQDGTAVNYLLTLRMVNIALHMPNIYNYSTNKRYKTLLHNTLVTKCAKRYPQDLAKCIKKAENTLKTVELNKLREIAKKVHMYFPLEAYVSLELRKSQLHCSSGDYPQSLLHCQEAMRKLEEHSAINPDIAKQLRCVIEQCTANIEKKINLIEVDSKQDFHCDPQVKEINLKTQPDFHCELQQKEIDLKMQPDFHCMQNEQVKVISENKESFNAVQEEKVLVYTSHYSSGTSSESSDLATLSEVVTDSSPDSDTLQV